MVILSAFTSATALAGPMLACDWKGHKYSASTNFTADFKAAATSPFLMSSERLRVGACRMCSCSFSNSGNGLLLATQVTFNSLAAFTASHSRSATTAKKFFSRTTRAPLMCLIEDSSTFSARPPATGVRMTLACNMPGTLTSAILPSVPKTFHATSLRGKDNPTTLYSDGSLGLATPLTSNGLPIRLFHSTLELKYLPPISSA